MSILRNWGQPWGRGDARRTNHVHLEVVTDALVEPIVVDEARRFLRVNFDTDDSLIQLMITGARQATEQFLRRALITQTRMITLDWGPAWVELPYGPIQSVSSVVVRALDGSDTTANPTTYFFNSHTSMVGLQPAAIWPTHISPGGWRCTYVAGYGNTATSVPAAIKLCLLNLLAGYYDKRGTFEQLVMQEAGLLPYRIMSQGIRMAGGLDPTEILA